MSGENGDSESVDDVSPAAVCQASVRAMAQHFEAMVVQSTEYSSTCGTLRSRGQKSGSSTTGSVHSDTPEADLLPAAHIDRANDDDDQPDDDLSPSPFSQCGESDGDGDDNDDAVSHDSHSRVFQMARHFEQLAHCEHILPSLQFASKGLNQSGASLDECADEIVQTDEEISRTLEAEVETKDTVGTSVSFECLLEDGFGSVNAFGSGEDEEIDNTIHLEDHVHTYDDIAQESYPKRPLRRNLSGLSMRLSSKHSFETKKAAIEAINPTIHHEDGNTSSADGDFTDSEFSSDDEVDEVAQEVTDERRTIHTLINQVPQIVGELLTNEQLYIQTLGRGIANYCSVYDDPTYMLPASVRGQKYHIFGNIERIKDFHENIFYPSLQQCETDVVQICETFCRFVEEHRFYMYVLYAINRKRADQLTDLNRQFFADRQNLQNDKLGINSFLVQPIQRLPRYQLLLREIIKELGKSLDVDGVKETIASCCRAEKHLQRLLDQVNSSMSINDIVDNTEVEILHQGKFRCLHEFDVYESESRRRYRAKAFLFDKGVLMAEVIDRETLSYRGFYMSSRLGVFEQDSYNFELYDQRRFTRQIELSSDANSVALWVKMLRENVLKEYSKRQTITSKAAGDIGQQQPTQRDSGISEASDDTQQQFVVVRNNRKRDPNASGSGSSNWTSGISDSSSVNSVDCDPRRTTWYTNVDSNLVSNGKTLERLINSEKHYILILTNYLKRYLLQIPDHRVPEHLGKYIRVVRTLIDFHTHHQYPKLCQSDQNIIEICATFRASLNNPVFVNAYQVYAGLSNRAYAVLDQFYSDGDSEIEHFTNIPLEHLRRANEFLDHLMIELKNADESFISNEFKAVAVAEVMLSKFRVRVTDNLNLNSIKGINRSFLDEFGLVEHGEAVSIYGYKNRLLLLERGLVCVRTRISTKTLREKFIDVDFALPLSAVRTSESNRSASRLKFFANYAREIVFKVDFATTAQKLALQARIDIFRNMEAS